MEIALESESEEVDRGNGVDLDDADTKESDEEREERDAASLSDDSGDKNYADGGEEDESSSEGEGDTFTPSGSAARSRASGASPSPAENRPKRVEWVSDEIRDRVLDLVLGDVCEDKCLAKREARIQSFLLSLEELTPHEQKVSLTTSLAVLKDADMSARQRGFGLRDKFHYYLPFVGRVCRDAFCRCYSVSSSTLSRYRERVKQGNFAPKPHGNKHNTNAKTIDTTWLVEWYKEFAAAVGEVVPVRVRRQETKDGRIHRYFSSCKFTLLPAHFTWAALHNEMQNYVTENGLSVRPPAESTMRKLLTQLCPTICIRSPWSNVCDVCAIYYTRSKAGPPTAAMTEEAGKRTQAARRMRQEYKTDMETVNDTHAVIIIDYSQNLTLSSVSSTPSQWYFLSLWSVNMLGIFYANKGIQYNYRYDESVAGKGSDEVISMVDTFSKSVLVGQGHTHLTIYADNCSGQNKNNFVVKFLTALTHMGKYEEVSLKFFIKGHTKNAVDRGFGHVRKKFAREDVWTMTQLLEVVEASASSSATVHVTSDSGVFRSYKSVLSEAYTDLTGIRKYQIFQARASCPGKVFCRVTPDDDPVEIDLRRRIDGVLTDDDKLRVMFENDIELLTHTLVNAEKRASMHTKVRPYVPAEFQDYELYIAPTDEQMEEAASVKRSRATRRAQKKKATVAAAAKPAARNEAAAEEIEGSTGVPCGAVAGSADVGESK